MERRPFGKTGMNVGILGLGGAELGFQGASQDEVNRLIDTALEVGINVVDTAECYKDSEEKLGHALKGRRDQVFLFTKCGHAAGFDGQDDWDPKMLEASIDRSLRLLQTDAVDLVQLHSCSTDLLRQGDVIDVVRRAKEAGKTRFIGYSGDSEAAEFAIRTGAFDALQTSVNIADQECITRTLPLAKEAGMGVIAKRPIANAAWTYAEEPVGMYAHEYWKRLQSLAYGDFEALDALQFTLEQDIHVAIVGSKNPDRPRTNAALAAKPIAAEKVARFRTRWQAHAPAEWTGQT